MRLTNPNLEEWKRYIAFRRIREVIFVFIGIIGGALLVASTTFTVNPLPLGFALGAAIALWVWLELTYHELIAQIDRYLND